MLYQKNVCTHLFAHVPHTFRCEHCGHVLSTNNARKNTMCVLLWTSVTYVVVLNVLKSHKYTRQVQGHYRAFDRPPLSDNGGGRWRGKLDKCPTGGVLEGTERSLDSRCGPYWSPPLPCCIGQITFNPLKEKHVFFVFFSLFLQKTWFFWNMSF